MDSTFKYELEKVIAEALGCERREASFGVFCDTHSYRRLAECDTQADAIAAALAPLIEARVREAQGPCTCPPWHPGTDGPEEDCAQHGRPYAYWVEYAGVLEGRISELLCDLTGGLLSDPGYDVPTMVQAVDQHFEARVREARADAWDEAVGETYDLGWLHDWARSDALARNPYRAEEVRRNA